MLLGWWCCTMMTMLTTRLVAATRGVSPRMLRGRPLSCSADDSIRKHTSTFPSMTEHQIDQLIQLSQHISDWNVKVNVISRKDIDQLVDRHLLPSLAITKLGLLRKGDRAIDVGTGGGFPGLPLAIAHPDVSFTLLDSCAKKIKVVDDIVKVMRLTNVQTVCSRAEQFEGNFDFVLGRAVTSIRNFLTFSGHFVPPASGRDDVRGGVLYIKGGDFQEELREAGIRDYTITAVQGLVPIESDKFVLSVPSSAVRRFRRAVSTFSPRR